MRAGSERRGGPEADEWEATKTKQEESPDQLLSDEIESEVQFTAAFFTANARRFKVVAVFFLIASAV